MVLALSWLLLQPPRALADGPTTFSNTAAIAIPATGSPNQVGPAAPYPSDIAVSGLAGPVSSITVTFSNLTHATLNDVDAMVVSPSGQSLVLLSDIGDPNTLRIANNTTLTFDDDAATSLLDVTTVAVPSGTYRPTNNNSGGTLDSFPAPAPAPSTQSTLAGAFSGINPNGTWRLFVVDDTTGDTGSMSGGWSLTVTTEVSAVATTTTVTSSDNASTTGDPVTFTATVRNGATPVTSGSVAFTVDGSAIGTGVSLDATGNASLTTSSLTEGTHLIRATYSGTTGFLASNGTVSQRVDNPTVVSGSTFCNTGPITPPSVGAASPYPSTVTVSGLAGTVTAVTATLKGLSHTAPIDLDVMLSGPTPTTNLLLMSDAGGQSPVSNLEVVFDDAAGSSLPSSGLTSGTYRPTNLGDQSNDAFPAPAPLASGAVALSTFAGTDGNGQWNLWVVDDATGDSGSISGGWCLTVTSLAPTTTSVTSSVNPADAGADVTFTSTTTSGGVPVTSGTVQFSDGATALGAPVSVAADGTATLTTSALTPGSHTITATYGGTASLGGSDGSVDQGVRPVASPGGPYTVAEGASLTLDPSGSTPGTTYAWDLDGDGAADVTGAAPTLTWADLESLGIDDGPSAHTVTLEVSLGSLMSAGTATLQVDNTAPTTVVSGDLTATVGVPFTVKVGADDPSSADLAAAFTYTVDWGDGTPVETVVGPADPPVTHSYATAGSFSASMTATDKDGGTSEPTVVQVLAEAAPATATPTPTPTPTTVSPSPTPPTSPSSPSPTTTSESSALAGTGSSVLAPLLGILLLVAGAVIVAAARPPGRHQ